MEDYNRKRQLIDKIIPVTQIATILGGLIISIWGLSYFSIFYEINAFYIFIIIFIIAVQIGEIYGIANLIEDFSHNYEYYARFLYTIFVLEILLLVSLIPAIQDIISFNLFILSAFFPSFVFIGILSASVLNFEGGFLFSFIGIIIDVVNFAFDINLLNSNILIETAILLLGSSLFFMGLIQRMNSNIKEDKRKIRKRRSHPF